MSRRAPPMLLVGLLLAGCVARNDEKLPAVTWRNHEEARQILAQRAEAVRTVTAEGLITLVRPDGESVRFDLAMVRDRDRGVRLRAWKLGRAVFDVTMTRDGGVWMLTPDDPSLKQKVRTAGVSARQLLDAWEMFNGEFFTTGEGKFDDRGGTLRYVSNNAFCDIDRRTLAPRRYGLTDDAGKLRFELELSDYREIAGVPFAQRYRARSRDEGEIRIALRDVELNTELAPAALKPPGRAEKLP
jgi:hypothetical protein